MPPHDWLVGLSGDNSLPDLLRRRYFTTCCLRPAATRNFSSASSAAFRMRRPEVVLVDPEVGPKLLTLGDGQGLMVGALILGELHMHETETAPPQACTRVVHCGTVRGSQS